MNIIVLDYVDKSSIVSTNCENIVIHAVPEKLSSVKALKMINTLSLYCPHSASILHLIFPNTGIKICILKITWNGIRSFKAVVDGEKCLTHAIPSNNGSTMSLATMISLVVIVGQVCRLIVRDNVLISIILFDDIFMTGVSLTCSQVSCFSGDVSWMSTDYSQN